MNSPEIHAKLALRFGESILTYSDAAKDPFVVVAPARIREIALFLRDDPELRFDFLFCHTGVDYPPASIAVVLHLYSYVHRHTFVVKALVDRNDPRMDSLVPVWATADWHERECFDLLGVRFEGHPDLRRLLLPDDWDGHPLRRDWKESASYQGIPTTRPDQMELVHLGGKTAVEAVTPPAPAGTETAS